MNFTKEQIEFLEKNRAYYDGLVRNGTLRNISSVTINAFKKLYKDAIANRDFAVWCDACVVELITLCYRNYETFQKEEGIVLTALNY